MIWVLTQNKAMVNLSAMQTITVQYDEDNNKYVVLADDFILGYFNTQDDAVAIILWISDTIGNTKKENQVLVIPNNVKVD